MRALNIISFVILIICMGMCIYDAINNNMFCVVWAVNCIIHFSNFKSTKE
jgi:hypothetical protein